MMEMLKDKITAVILAAGQGTRMKASPPKVLHQILGRPMIVYLLDTLTNLGIGDILVVVGDQAEKVQEALKEYSVRFVVQEPQLGTGHAVQVAMAAVPPEAKEIMVLCGDAPLISREINTGAYCFATPFLRQALDQIPKSPVTGEIYLTDLIHIAREQGRRVEALIDPNREDLLGINSRAELAAATQTVKRKINARHMDQGVTLIDPEAAYIESLVTIGRDTVIYPNVYLQGKTVIGENCVIESTVKIVDSTLEEDVYVKMGCVVTQSRLGAGGASGPFAHLRPLSDLRQGVHVGNFVEGKKSVLHEGVKAGHATYLGAL